MHYHPDPPHSIRLYLVPSPSPESDFHAIAGELNTTPTPGRVISNFVLIERKRAGEVLTGFISKIIPCLKFPLSLMSPQKNLGKTSSQQHQH